MKRASVAIFFALFLFSGILNAGSILSSRGIGIYSRYALPRSLGMGGISIALSDPYYFSKNNPASLLRLRTTRITLQYRYELNQYQDPVASANSTYSNFDGFCLAFPLGSGMSAMIDLSPYTKIDFMLDYNKTLMNQDYQKTVEGSGGLNQLSFSYSWGINEKLGIGISAQYTFGRMKEEWRVNYEDDSFNDSQDVFSVKNSGMAFTYGLFINPLKGLDLAATYSPGFTVRNNEDLYTIFATEQIHSESDITLPPSFSIGASGRINSFLLLGAEFTGRDWTKMKINGQTPDRMKNVTILGCGAELFASNKLNDPYWKRMAYRIGFNTQPFYYTDLEGNTIREHWLTLGFSLPAFMGISQIDISVGIGRRGSLDPNNISENLLRLSASITGGEKWFVRRY